MKHILITFLILFFFTKNLNSAELISEGAGNFQLEIILTDKSKVSTFTTKGTFKNNIAIWFFYLYRIY